MMGWARTLTPGVQRLRAYDRAWLRGDVLAGITVAAYLIPQVMAYAEVAGLPPVVGLWAIIGPLVVYAALGSSRQLSMGPESTTALMTAVVVAPLAAGDPARYAALAAALAFVVAAICLLAWLARLGFLADLLSRPVLIGYLAGLAVIMIVSQLTTLTGVPVEGQTLGERLSSFAGHLNQVELPTLALAAGALVIMLVGARRWPKAPVPLIAMLVAAVAVAVFGLDRHGVQVLGEVPAGLPTPALPDVSIDELTSLLLPAIGVAIVGYTDNVLTARAFASRRGYRIDANQELLALGTANLSAGLLRGFPVSSSASRTAIGDALGSRSQLHSLVALGVVTSVLLVAQRVLEAFPTAVLGAIVVFAALRLVDFGELRRFAAFRSSELVLAVLATAAVLVLGVLYGVLAAVGLSILELVRRVARPHDGILGQVPGVAGMHDIDDYPDARQVPGLVVYRYDAPLCFANAENFRQRALAAANAAPMPVEWFLLNAEANVEIDITATDALEQLRGELAERGVVFAMARVKQDLRVYLAAAGLVDRVGADRIFPTLPTAVSAYTDWYEEKYGRSPPVEA
jgi:sulfate permease, SulP family